MAYAPDASDSCIVDIALKWDIRNNAKTTAVFIGPCTRVIFAARSADLIADPYIVQIFHEKAINRGGKYKDSEHKITLTLLAGEYIELKCKVKAKGRTDTFPMMRSVLFQHGWISTGLLDLERDTKHFERERWAVTTDYREIS